MLALRNNSIGFRCGWSLGLCLALAGVAQAQIELTSDAFSRRPSQSVERAATPNRSLRPTLRKPAYSSHVVQAQAQMPAEGVTKVTPFPPTTIYATDESPESPDPTEDPFADASESIPTPNPQADQLVSLVVREATIGEVLSLVAEQHGLNVVTGDQVSATVSVALHNIPLNDALDAILTANGYTWIMRQNVLMVSSLSAETKLSPFAQGRQVRVFDLNFISAADVDRVVKGLLSPVGQSFLIETALNDKRRTHEQLIVEDMPDYLARIEAYVCQADQAPHQVLIQAHILQITLNDTCSHGVNLQALAGDLTIDTFGFNTSLISRTPGTINPASSESLIQIDGGNLKALIELLENTTDAKTLASPKVWALNGQEARIQIGGQFGYFVTTTTQTSTQQSVEFLDVGVVLVVTPIISQDGRVLMNVKPEVSSGRINPETGLPDKETTEVETTIMLEDGHGMVIGGLIQEEDTETQTKVPYLGDLYGVGRLFQNRSVTRERKEIIVALVPYIQPLDQAVCIREEVELSRAQTRLTTPPLQRLDRRMWEPELHDAIYNPIRPIADHVAPAPAPEPAPSPGPARRSYGRYHR